jgi:hypothetical protein
MKARSEPTSFGTVGTGSAAHLCGLYFAQKTGLHLQYVPYRGAGPAMQDLIGGQIDLSCLEASSGLAYVQAAKFKAFAVFSEQRWPKSPETPTMLESGIPGATITFWHALWTTKGTPKETVDRLDAAVISALANPAVQQRLETLGQVMFPRDQQGPAVLAAYHKAEIDKWWPIIKAAGIKAEWLPGENSGSDHRHRCCRPKLHRHIAGLFDDAIEPGADCRKRRQVVIAFRGNMGIGVERDVGDRVMASDKEIVHRKVLLHYAECAIAFLHPVFERVLLQFTTAFDQRQPEIGGAEIGLEAVLFKKHPLQRFGPTDAIFGCERGAAGDVPKNSI